MKVLVVIWILNLFDAVAILYEVRNDLAFEINPLMAYLLQLGGFEFISVKVAIVMLGLILLYLLRQYQSITAAVYAMLVAYMVVCLYHCVGLMLLF